MRKGFTLLELVIVLIIIGVLATLAIGQYARMVEKARGAEARQILGLIRTAEAGYRMENTACTTTAAAVGIGTDIPGPAAGNCAVTNYFWYNVSAASGTGFTAQATRCTALGKNVGPAGASITLVTDFVSGADSWTSTSHY